MKKYYTCWGDVRGCCGIAHRSIEAAQRCIEEDQKGCEGQGGYSDREIRVVESPGEIESYDVTRGPGESYQGDGWE